jgi:hypothetical protein
MEDHGRDPRATRIGSFIVGTIPDTTLAEAIEHRATRIIEWGIVADHEFGQFGTRQD